MTSTVPAATSIEDEERLRETDLTASLSRLREVHVSLRHLRDTIPRIVSTIQQASTNSTPDDLYLQFSTAALGAGSDIKTFMQLMGEASTKEVLEKAKASKEEDAGGIEGWKVVEHEDWLEVKNEEGDEGNAIKSEYMLGVEAMDDESGKGEKTEEEVKTLVENFTEAHKGIETSVGENGKNISFKLPVPSNLHFQIRAVTASDGQFSYTVTLIGHNNERYGSIREIIATRPRAGDLLFLLEMLSSYTDLHTRKCQKCSRLVDRTNKIPIIRRRKASKQKDGKVSTEWEAFHQSCM